MNAAGQVEKPRETSAIQLHNSEMVPELEADLSLCCMYIMNFLPAVTAHARYMPVRNAHLEFRLHPMSP
jgi:hypothetical protein